jgi:hypothetical protein
MPIRRLMSSAFLCAALTASAAEAPSDALNDASAAAVTPPPDLAVLPADEMA